MTTASKFTMWEVRRLRSSLAVFLMAFAIPALGQIDARPQHFAGDCSNDAARGSVAPLEPHGAGGELPRTMLPSGWDWLAGTYWYVPQEDLPAYLYDTQSQASAFATDQTVFHIVESKGGYFRGTAVAQIGTSKSSFVMLGVVTPDHSVLLTFLPADTTGATTSGSGRFTLTQRQIAMLNQMSSSPNERLKVLHWAYMLQTEPGDAIWDHLPGVNVSVPQFLAGQ